MALDTTNPHESHRNDNGSQSTDMAPTTGFARALDVLEKPRRVALVGNPNTGKTTLFNKLTGFRHRVGNYPGVTVDKRTGFIRGGADGPPIEVMDLPGTYSLAAGARDEAVVLDVLLGNDTKQPRPDIIVCVVDASNLARNLFLTTQILELGRPVVVALNMIDVAERHGIQIDVEAFAHDLGVTVVPIVANKGLGVSDVKAAIINALHRGVKSRCTDFPACVCAELDGLCETLADGGTCPDPEATRVQAMQTLLGPGGYHESRMIERCGRGFADELAERRERITQSGENVVELEARVRYAWIDRVLSDTVIKSDKRRRSTTDRIDRITTHPLAGLVVLFCIMATCFQAIYTWAGPLMDAVDSVFAVVGESIAQWMPEGALQSLIVNGVVAGVGGVLIFLPQILILFFFIAILEDCGYMARAAFLLDRWMRMFGLGGKSFIPLLSSFACAVPGVMATRTIEDRRDRFVTMLIAPLMSCSARLPVYVLMIAAFVPDKPLLGRWLNLQAVTLLGMYVLGVAVAIPAAIILKKTVFNGGPVQSFLMELPTYKRPSLRTAFHRMYEQGHAFVINAGTVIVAVSIIIWALAYYPRSATVTAETQAHREQVHAAYDAKLATIATTLTPGSDAGTFILSPPIADALAEIHAMEEAITQTHEESEHEHAEHDTAEDHDAIDPEIVTAMERRGPAGRAALAVHHAQTVRDDELARVDHEQSGAYLRQSALGYMGRLIEPIVKPLGWDWRIGMAAIASFPAREIVVATMGTIYNLGADQDETSHGLRQKMQAATWPDGRPVFNMPVAMSIMVFFALCCQCAATLATIRRETASWRWPFLTFSYMTGLAYIAAAFTYQVLSRLS